MAQRVFQNTKHSQTTAGSAGHAWLDPAVCHRTSGEERMALFNNFQKTAFRLEALDQYLVEAEKVQFQGYLVGDELKNTRNKDWTDYIQQQVQLGKSIERIHVIPRVLTDYLKFEIDWGYRYSEQAGEKISLVYRDEVPLSMKSLTLPDFWLFDDSTCLIQRYDRFGTWHGADMLHSEKGIEQLRSVRDELRRVCFPLDQHPHVKS